MQQALPHEDNPSTPTPVLPHTRLLVPQHATSARTHTHMSLTHVACHTHMSHVTHIYITHVGPQQDEGLPHLLPRSAGPCPCHTVSDEPDSSSSRTRTSTSTTGRQGQDRNSSSSSSTISSTISGPQPRQRSSEPLCWQRASPPPTARHTLGPTAPYPTLTPTSPPTRLPRCCKQRMHTPLPSPLQHKRRGCPHQILRTPPAPPGLMPVPLPPLPPTKTATTNLSTHTQTHALCRPHSLVPLALHHLALLYA